jgi:hypothetical protein
VSPPTNKEKIFSFYRSFREKRNFKGFLALPLKKILFNDTDFPIEKNNRTKWISQGKSWQNFLRS